ncbi:retrovirus-related Pol polyprotein from type-1 retrotransposable element R1 4 isoform X2 [Bombyx mori]|uniref:retrovirus-related Pol polyprotein from type-1 retrotransposable element R1 4 isoform X2 n=1 Tax=Bombyx mori TaxID=7091 RepID=UPI002ED670D5
MSSLIGGVRVEIEATGLRYLGLVLDGRWSFRAHFERLGPRLMAAAGSLSRLLPNVEGPDVVVRRLYTGVVRSMALYGAPVWCHALTRDNVAALRRPQRAIAVRAVREYCTVSFEAACVLAGTPPWNLEAEALAADYAWRCDLRSRGEPRPGAAEVRARKLQSRRAVLEAWSRSLADPAYGRRTVEAIRPVLSDWVNRDRGRLTFRATQVLTGHGCFGRYLHLVARREPTPKCHHCSGCNEDTAEHTLAYCPAFAEQRRVLVANIGPDLSLPTVVATMLGSDESWQAMLDFCESIMSQKEAAERERESSSSLSAPCRRRRAGGRRRVFVQLRPL